MRVRVLKIGKPADKAYATLVEKFEKRLRPFCRVENLVLKAQDGVEKSKKDLFSKLGLDLNKSSKDSSHVIVTLDERGRNFSSPEIAKIFQDKLNDGRVKNLTFVIGGPYGVPKELREISDHVWSLSKAVFPSDLAWTMVWEQVYRATTIIRGTAYHHV